MPHGIQPHGSARWLILARAMDGVSRWAHGLGQQAPVAITG